MEWFFIFVKDLKVNFLPASSVFITFGVIALVGLVFFRTLFKEKSLGIVVPGGIVAGAAFFILYLGVLSHIFKGRLGIWIIFLVYFLSGLLVYYRNRNAFKFRLPNVNLNSIAFFVLSYLLLLMIFIKAGNAVFGGDAITYWGLSTSFANGNYPQVLPWQPQFLTVHHQGAFLLEGAVHAISGADIRVVHFIFASLIISGGLFLLWGFLANSTRSAFLSLIPSVLGYITFGGFFILLPQSFSRIESQRFIAEMPTLYNAKNALGALTSFFDLYYLIPRTTALAIIILAFMVIAGKFIGSQRKRLLILASISAVILSVDESMFAVIILPISLWLVFGFFKSDWKKKFLKDAFISLLLFFTLFWVIGNPVRDSLITPSPEAPRFQFVGLADTIKQGRIGFLKSVSINSSKTPWVVWYLPDLRLMLALTLFFALLWGGQFALLFFLAALGTTILYFFVEHTFWPGNHARFLLTGYLFNGFSLGVSIVNMLKTKRPKILVKILATLLLLALVPSSLAATFKILKSLPSGRYSNFYPIGPEYEVLDWIRENLPYNARVFFIDGFLHGHSASELTLYGIESHGLFIPTASANIKMHTAEWGIEAIDAVNTISPAALKDLGIEYLFIKSDQFQRFSKERRLDFRNNIFFEPIYEDNLGVLYKVKRSYFLGGYEEDGTIRKLTGLIPSSSDIYVDSIPNLNYYLRSVLFLALKDKGDLYSVWGPGHFNYVETFIEIVDPTLAEQFDYLILGPDTSPYKICPDCRFFKKIWETQGVVVHEVK